MLKRLLFMALIVYTIVIGATYNGILEGRIRFLDVLIGGAGLAAWLWARRRWRWYRTPLDTAILVWIAAFALSLLLNLDSWRRIAIGLWFMALYIGVWYALQNSLANRALRREWLVDGLLIGGVAVVFVGFAQIENVLISGLALPRPGSVLGNPNTLAAFLVMLMPFIAGRLLAAKTAFARVSLAVYGAVALGLLLLSFSRAGWLGAAAALAVWVSLSFPLRRWWRGQPRPVQTALLVGGAAVVVVGLYFVASSFGLGGRELDLRTWIYSSAVQMFIERPVTGSGLFTFGAGLARLNSMPPIDPHSHAHNIILNVAAELGIVGLAALALTAWIVYRAAHRPSDSTTIMGIAAFAGFATHQMFDVPAMMPGIALVALAALVLVLPATQEDKRARWQPRLLALGGAALMLTGLWSAFSYGAYVTILGDANTSGDYRGAAEQLQPLIDADPSYAIYYQQQGMLLGLAAAAGDLQAAREGAADFERYLAIEPDYSSAWANLAALREQIGEAQQAENAMQEAALLTPKSWSLLYRAGADAEAAGDNDAARTTYLYLIKLNPDVALLPGWNDSPVRSALQADASQLTMPAQVILRLESGDRAGAEQLWESYPGKGDALIDHYVVASLIAQAEGDPALAQAKVQAATQAAYDAGTRAWSHIGAALLDTANFDSEVANARSELGSSPYSADWAMGANIAYIQYLSLAIPRQFLPQVGYTEADPLVLHLLGDAGALPKIRATLGV